MTLQEYKETININQLAYIHLTKLFVDREQTGHIVNMISIAGMQGMTAIRNSDYSASKAALTSFFDCLRQEFLDECSPIKITNIYPYVIDTDLFKGFSGYALNLIPILRKSSVAFRVYEAIMYEEEEVYIPWHSYWAGVVMMVVRGFSETVRVKIIQKLMGDGMKTVKKDVKKD